MLHGYYFFFFPGFLPFLSFFPFFDFFFFLLNFLLNMGYLFVKVSNEMRELGIDLVGQVAEVDTSLIVDPLEEHNRSKIFLKILDLLLRQLLLEDVHYVFLLTRHYFLSQIYYRSLQLHNPINVPPQVLQLYRIDIYNLSTNYLYLCVGNCCNLVDKVSDRKFGTFTYNVLDMLATDILHVLNATHYTVLIVTRLERRRSLTRLLEQQHSSLIHQEIQKLLLVRIEKRTILPSQLSNLTDLLIVVFDAVIRSSSVYNKANTISDVIESAETCMKVFDELRHLVSPSLTNMSLVHHQYNFDMTVHIQQSLHEERVADLYFLAVIILKSWTIVKGHSFNIHLSGNSCLGKALVSYSDLRLLCRGSVVQDRLKVSASYYFELISCQEGHNGRLTHSSISYHKHCVVLVCLPSSHSFGSLVNESLQELEVDRLGIVVHYLKQHLYCENQIQRTLIISFTRCTTTSFFLLQLSLIDKMKYTQFHRSNSSQSLYQRLGLLDIFCCQLLSFPLATFHLLICLLTPFHDLNKSILFPALQRTSQGRVNFYSETLISLLQVLRRQFDHTDLSWNKLFE